MRVLIVGCGYLGTRAGELLVQAGHEVFGTRRTAERAGELSALGIQPVLFDFSDRASCSTLPNHTSALIHCASTSKGGTEAYREVFESGLSTLEQWAESQTLARFVLASSTSVYGQLDGAWVTESSPTCPSTEGGKILVETELRAMESAKLPSIILRFAGLYGSGRGYHLQAFLEGKSRIGSSSDRWINMIHRDDAALAIVAAITQAPIRTIYNVADDEPTTQAELLRWLSATTGRPVPNLAEGETPLPTKRARTNKKVSNRKLTQELRWKPQYPTFREGFLQELRSMGFQR